MLYLPLRPYIMNPRLGPEFFPEPERFVLGEEFRDGALGVVDIAEHACINRADVHAGGGSLMINPWGQPHFEAAVNPMTAKRAFFYYAAYPSVDLRLSPYRLVLIFIFGCLPIETAYIIRACYFAIPAADAPVVVHCHDAVFPDPRRPHRAYFYTGRFRTMQAWPRHKKICSALGPFWKANIPSFIFVRDIIDSLACPQTILAPNTLG
jgi:hypothetical protein